MKQAAGTSNLVRLILRRDRFSLALWIAILAVLPLITVVSFEQLFPTEAQRQQFFVTTASQPSYTALLGPGFGSSAGALAIQRAGIIFVFVALANLLTVIRHTRSEEEAGRRELLGSTVVGRQAPLTAALVVSLGASATLGFCIAGVLLTQGLPLAGSVAFASAVAATGAIFGGVGALTAQLTTGAASARGIALVTLGASFLLRAAGDASGDDRVTRWLAWLSPIGSVQRTRAFTDERWWVFAPAAGLFVLLLTAAYLLSARRDLGAGLISSRTGAAGASSALSSPLGLAWRLQRGALIGWMGGLAVFGAVVGLITRDAAQAMADNEELADLIQRLGGGAVLADAYLSAMMGFFTFIVSAYAIQAVLRLREEEETQRADLVLATAVGRLRWAGSHLSIALVGSALALFVVGLTAGCVYGLVQGDLTGQVSRLSVAALAQLPAVWLIATLALALFGVRSRAAGLSWFVLGACLFLGQFGAVLQLPAWILDLSPFSHLPRLPGGAFDPIPALTMLAIASVLLMLGLASLRRRDFGV